MHRSAGTAAAPLAGSSRFEVEGRLGAGGMGVVYGVVDREVGLRLALKELRAPAPDDLLGFKAEFRALRDLTHPNLLRLFELVEEDGRWFFTMERVEGQDFLSYVRGETNPGDPAPSTGSGRSLGRSSGWTRDARDPGQSGSRVIGAAPPLDEARLRSALAQLVLGLDALHRGGLVHRDVKPSNVLVEAGGRVVLLDFGVVASRGEDGEGGAIVGTAAYMAPEQACGESPEPAADWYAVGVMLFQALAGRVPFEGTATEMLSQKVTVDAPSPAAFAASAPADLEALCLALLAREPAQRPDAVRILRALGVAEPEAMLAQSRQGASTPFVGRRAEVQALLDAFAESRRPGGVLVFVEGPSGMGKSATVAHALEHLRARERGLIVLRGRCHERETVPFNAFDGVVDDLSRALRALEEGGGALPVVSPAVLRLFPMLAAVPGLAPLAEAAGQGGASVEQRRQAFAGLRALMDAVAARRPVVVVLEDSHWADAESLLLLEAWAEAPAPRVLLVATARPGPDGDPCAAFRSAGPAARRLRLEPLGDAEAHALVAAMSRAEGAPPSVEAIVREGRGHPMFLAELAAYTREHGGGGQGVHLDDALLARVDAMAPLARRALEVVAAAGVPLREATIGQALAASRTALAAQLSLLQSARLLRAAGARSFAALEPYHDRVREAVYARMAPEARAAVHGRLAELLAAEGAPPEVLLGHFEKAGDHVRAAAQAVLAAEQAAASLAFERAAHLYGFALRTVSHGPVTERRLRACMGDALAKAGRPKDAALAYAAASRIGEVPEDEAFDLRRRAAEQLLMGGYLTEGVGASEAVLAHLGERRPASTFALFLVAFWELLRLSLVRFRWTSRAPEEVAPAAQRRLDVYWSLGAGFAFLDSIRGASFSLPGARLAVAAGDELRIARATCAACIGVSGQGDARLAERLRAASRRAADGAGTDLARFYADLADLGHTFMIQNDCRKTLEASDRAREQWARVGQRGGWESDLTEQFQLWALAAMGHLPRLVTEVDEGLRFARAVGNRFREHMMRIAFPHRYLLADDPDAGARDVQEALTAWSPPGGGFSTPQYWALKSRALLVSYGGTWEAALPELRAAFRRFHRSPLAVLGLLTMEAAEIQAHLALRAALAAERRGQRAVWRAEVAVIRRCLRRLRRCPLPFAGPQGDLVAAAYALARHGFEVARPLYHAALASSEREGFDGNVAAVRYTLGLREGGDAGRAHLDAARAWAVAQGARSPERLLRGLASGAPDDP